MADLSEIAESLVEMDIAKTEELTKAAIDANIPAGEISYAAGCSVRKKERNSVYSTRYRYL